MTIEATENFDETKATFNIWDILFALGKRKYTLFGVPLLVALAVGVFCSLKPPIYSATARVLPPLYNQYNVNNMNQQLGGESSLGNASVSVKNPSDLYVGILHSTRILDALIERFKLKAYYKLDVQDDAREKLLSMTEVRVGKDGILSIMVEDTNAQMAADMANAYVDALYSYSRDLAQREAMRRTSFYESVLGQARDKLKAADLALLAVQKRTGYTSLMGQDEAIVTEASTLQESIAQNRAKLESLLTFATENHPDVKMLRSEIASMESQVSQLAKGNVVGSKQPFVAIGDVPAAMLEHTEKTREVTYWQGVVEMLGKYNEMGKIDETRDISLIQKLDSAVPSYYKSKPKTKLNVILAFMATWLFCLIYIVFTEWLGMVSSTNADLNSKIQRVKAAWSPIPAFFRRKPKM